MDLDRFLTDRKVERDAIKSAAKISGTDKSEPREAYGYDARLSSRTAESFSLHPPCSYRYLVKTRRRSRICLLFARRAIFPDVSVAISAG